MMACTIHSNRQEIPELKVTQRKDPSMDLRGFITSVHHRPLGTDSLKHPVLGQKPAKWPPGSQSTYNQPSFSKRAVFFLGQGDLFQPSPLVLQA